MAIECKSYFNWTCIRWYLISLKWMCHFATCFISYFFPTSSFDWDAAIYILVKYILYDSCLLVTHRINVDVSFGILPRLSLSFIRDFSTESVKRTEKSRKRESFLAKLKFSFSHMSKTYNRTNARRRAEKWKRELKAILW